MIIEVVIFFIWIFIVLLVSGIVVLKQRRKRTLQRTDNIDPGLSFPQRNWLLLCLVIAVVSPLLVNGLETVTRKKMHKEPVQQNGTAYSYGDSTGRDTSYHVATPPAQK